MTQGPIGEAHILVSPELRSFASRLNAELTAAMRGVRDPKIHARVDIDRTSLRGATRDVDLFSRRSKAAFSSLRREVFNSNIRLREMANILGGATLPVLVSLASVGVAAFGSLSAAAASAAAAIAVLPGLLAAAVQAVGVIGLAFSGVKDAVKAMGDAQATAGKDAAASARQQTAAADAIKAAQRGVRDALQGVRDAQRDLNDTRREARQRLVDLRLEEIRLSLDLRGATLGIKEAEADLFQVTKDSGASSLERRKAQLAVEQALANQIKVNRDLRSTDLQRQQAQLKVDQARAKQAQVESDAGPTSLERQRARLRVEEARLARQEIVRRIALNKAEARSGVEGSDQVVAAKERQRDAAQQLRDAQEGLAKAQRNAATSSVAAAGGVDKLGQAMAKLSPAGQRFARFLFSLKPKLTELRAVAAAGFLPGVESAIRRLVGAHFPALRTIVDATARTLGNLAVEGGKLLSSGPFRRDFAAFGADNVRIIREAGQGFLNLVDAFRNVTSAARPLVLTISGMVLAWTENVKASAAAGRESGKLGRFFRAAGESLRSLLRIAGNVGRTLGAVLAAAFPSGSALLTNLEAATGRMRDLATSARGGEALREFFDKARPAVESIAGLLVILARKLFEVVVHIKTVTERVAEFLDQHPQLKDLLGTALALALAFKGLNVAGLLGVVGSIGQLALVNPVLALVVGGILALGAAFTIAYTNNKPFKDAVDSLGRKIKDVVLPALKSFGKFIKEDVIPALQRAIPFVRDQLVAGLTFLRDRLKENEPQLKLVGKALLEIGKFIAVTVIPFLFRLYSVYLRGLLTAFGGVITMIGLVVRSFKFFIQVAIGVFGTLLDGAARAFGWIPGIGPKLKTANEKFKTFAKGVNDALDSTTKPRAIKVEANFGFQGLKTFNIKNSRVKLAAKGWRVDEGTGPTADDVLARVSRGETIVPAAASDDPWFKTWAAYQRIPGFASGGRVGLNPEARPPPLSVFQQALGHFEEGIGEAVRSAAGLFKRQQSASGAVSGAKFGSGAMHYIAEFIRKAGVAFQIISGFRPGARTRGTGSVSLHALGRALDLVGSGKSSMMDIWAAATRIPFKKEVIFSPAPFQVYGRGKHPGPPTNPRTRADHYNHVHIGLFDRGGPLFPGLNLMENRTGRTEHLVPVQPGRDALGRPTLGGTGMHVENLVVQPLSGRFRLRDVMTELALQGVH